MPKALCWTGMVIAILVLILFFFDLLFGLFGMTGLAPFQGTKKLLDIAFIICAAGLAFLSWTTLKEVS
jgi:hypothetical protein